MTAGNFIKDNLALVAGIAVPVLLVVGFLLTSTLGKLFTAPPAHTAYFVLQESDYKKKASASTNITVGDDGTLIVTITPVQARNDDSYYTQSDVLVTYDAAKDKLTEHRLTIPQGKTKGTFTPDEFKNLRLNTQAQAADGYSVTHGGRGGRSLMADIFIASPADGYRIRKNGAVYRMPERAVNGLNTSYYNRYYNLRFLGWGAEKNQ